MKISPYKKEPVRNYECDHREGRQLVSRTCRIGVHKNGNWGGFLVDLKRFDVLHMKYS